MKNIYDRMPYLIDDVTVKIQQLDVNDIVMPLKGHSEWLDGIYRDTKGNIDAQLRSLLIIYIEKIAQYNEMLKKKHATIKGVVEARDNTMKVLHSYEDSMKKH